MQLFVHMAATSSLGKFTGKKMEVAFAECNFPQYPEFQNIPHFILTSIDDPTSRNLSAMDRLALSLHEDSKRLTARFGDEIEELSSVQSELVNRSDVLTSFVIGLENEHDGLKKKAKEMGDEADVLLNWLKVYGDYDVDVDIDDVFEGVDGKSVAVIEYLVADMAMEDLLYSLEKAVEKGGIYGSFDSYLKQVRNLARTQYVFRAKWMKALQGSIN